MPLGLLSSQGLTGAGKSAPKIGMTGGLGPHQRDLCIDCPYVFITLQLIASMVRQPKAITVGTGVFYDLVLEEIFCQLRCALFVSQKNTDEI